MADLPESNEWTGGIYQLETSDPVLGGPEGIDNLQAKQLANRTIWLKAQLEQLGSNKQASDATLSALAALSVAANQIIYSTGPDAFAMTGLSAFIRTLLDDADAAAARTTLGAAALASPTFTGDPKAPTPAQFDNDTTVPTTEFVQRALGSYSGFGSIAASRSATAADVGKLFLVSSTGTTFTLPTPASLGLTQGNAIELFSTSGSMVIAPGAGATLNSAAVSVSSLTLLSGQSLRLVVIGTNLWQVTSSTNGLVANAEFAALLGATFSSQQLPGLSIKVGNISNSSTAASIPLTFPVAFPVACVALIITGANGMTAVYNHQGKDRTGATVLRGANANYQYDYIIVGY
jgi:hypothetical protein